MFQDFCFGSVLGFRVGAVAGCLAVRGLRFGGLQGFPFSSTLIQDASSVSMQGLTSDVWPECPSLLMSFVRLAYFVSCECWLSVHVWGFGSLLSDDEAWELQATMMPRNPKRH